MTIGRSSKPPPEYNYIVEPLPPNTIGIVVEGSGPPPQQIVRALPKNAIGIAVLKNDA